MTTAERIQEGIAHMPEGEPFSPASLLALGSRAAIDQALSRLVKRGHLSRVTRGIYARPKASKWIGPVPPEPARVARALAEACGAKVEIHGAEAARRFGLTTQVPTQPVFLTSGPSRQFKLGNLNCALKHVSARKLALAGRPAGLALTALWYLGKDQVTVATILKICMQLEPAEFEALREAPMPGWLRSVILASEEATASG